MPKKRVLLVDDNSAVRSLVRRSDIRSSVRRRSVTAARIPIPGAEIYYEKNFLSAEEATNLFDALQAKCAWERRRSSFKYSVPRDEAYYGDPGTNYTYSRREYRPLAWIPELLGLRTRVEEVTPATAYANLSLPKVSYNAVLCNLYRNGNDSVGLPIDAEPEMGPVIASVSLGAERLLRLKEAKWSYGFCGTIAAWQRVDHGGSNAEEFQARSSKRTGCHSGAH
jgi:alkylated DNA repair dioxygenase AlkB